jgi:preprotein translocase subunit SecG
MILTLHIVVCLILVVLVLLQSGKEGMGVIFGGGSQSLFGGTGAGGILVKLTAFIAVIFVVTSLSYNILTARQVEHESVILDLSTEDPSVPDAAPALPSPSPQDGPALPAPSPQGGPALPAPSPQGGPALPAPSPQGALAPADQPAK